MALTLVIGNKNYSSWSFRGWLALAAYDIPFDEVLLPLWRDGFAEKLARYTPAGRVPVLIDDDVQVWESIAIIEYLAEKFPEKHYWPHARAARAHARTIAAEMHAGFTALRKHCPMNFWRPPGQRELPPQAAADVARIEAIWTDCRQRFGAGGPFLFGAFSAADAMYAPIVSRFVTYGVAVNATAAAYMEAMQALPAWQQWKTAALAEPWVVAEDEVDWPTVLRV